MRVDTTSGRPYRNFWEWLLDGWHRYFILMPLIGYGWYLGSTSEV